MTPYYESDGCTIYHGDCRTVLGSLELEGGSVLITDPPYSSGALQEAGKRTGGIGTTADVTLMRNDQLSTRGYRRLLGHVLADLVPSEMYAFTDWRIWIELFDVAEEGGLHVRNMIVWDKIDPGLGSPWRGQHELICYAVSGRPAPRWGPGNVRRWARGKKALHPTEKPVGLLLDLVGAAEAGRTIVDPFAGSGTTLVAARRLGRRAIGIEIEEKYCEIAAQRLSQAVLDLVSP